MHSMRIGILDDISTIAEMIAWTAKLAGHSAQCYPGAIELLAAITQLDLLIIDLCLPGEMQGEHIAQAAQVFHQDIPIILISAKDAYEVHQRTQHLTGIDILIKPFHITELTQSIEKFNSIPPISNKYKHQTSCDIGHGRGPRTALYALPES